jgi:carbonic anhydrase
MRELSRRDAVRMLGMSVAAVGVATAGPSWFGASIARASVGTAAEATMTPEEALARLVAGNRRFVANRARSPRQTTVRRVRVAQGQQPFASIVSCSDSRVPIEIVFDQGLGDLFGVRVAGNTVSTDPVGLGSVQYGCIELSTPLVMVLGHSDCGAVKAALEVVTDGTQLPGDLPDVVAPILPVAQQSLTLPKSEQLDATVEANVRAQVSALAADPLLAERVAKHTLKIVGAEYELHTGKVQLLS